MLHIRKPGLEFITDTFFTKHIFTLSKAMIIIIVNKLDMGCLLVSQGRIWSIKVIISAFSFSGRIFAVL